MPYKAMHPCGHPGCPEIVPSGEKYCKKHSPLHKGEDVRPGRKNGNLYGTAKWQKMRRVVLTTHPICQICGKATADVVDHIKPHRSDPELFWDSRNLQALCKKCHDRKSLKEEKNPVYEY